MSYINVKDGIKIGGSTSFAGGIPYNLNLRIPTDTSPARCTISVVNKDGIYGRPTLSTTALTSIRAGSFQMDMYPISWKKSLRATQKVLEVEFIDGSIILDKIQVGLLGEFAPLVEQEIYTGPIQYFSESQGKEIVYNNTSQYIKIAGATSNIQGNLIILGRQIIDPRNPCGTPIIKYNFKELLEAIRAKGINIQGNIDVNEKYFQQYNGSLRDVLSSWCGDYGYSFYWSKGAIKFLDLRTAITIQQPNASETETISEGESLEGTYKQIAVSSFRKGKEEKNNTNTTYRLIFFRCLRLTDLMGLETGMEIEKEAMLGYYSDKLRNYYMINNVNRLDHLGFDVKDEWYDGSTNYNAIKQALTDAGDEDSKRLVALMNSTTGGRIARVVYRSSQKSARYDTIYRLAEQFIGKYFITNQLITPSTETPDFIQRTTVKTKSGSVRFIQPSTPLSSMPFSEIIAFANSQASINNETDPNYNPAAGSYLLDKSPTYTPSNDSNLVGKLDAVIDKFMPVQIGIGKIDAALKTTLALDDYQDLYFFPNANSSPEALTITFDYGNNFEEKDTVSLNSAPLPDDQTIYESCEGSIKKYEKELDKNNIFQNRYGLLNNGNAPTVTVNGIGINLVITGPVQSDYQAVEIVSRTKRYKIPKVDKVLSSGTLSDGDYLVSRVLQKNNTADYILADDAPPEVREQDILVINRLGGGQSYVTQSIDDYLEETLLNIEHENLGPAQQYELRQANFPTINPSPEQGLTEMNIEVTSNGVFTNYKFNSRPKHVPSLELIATKLHSEYNVATFKRSST